MEQLGQFVGAFNLFVRAMRVEVNADGPEIPVVRVDLKERVLISLTTDRSPIG